jgi:hypothetical protein
MNDSATYKPTLEQLAYRFQYLEKYGPNRWGDGPSDGERRLRLATEEIVKFARKSKRKPLRAYSRRPIGALIEDIEHLLNCGEGEHAILKAIGYAGREDALQARLRRSCRQDLTQRIFPRGWMAA